MDNKEAFKFALKETKPLFQVTAAIVLALGGMFLMDRYRSHVESYTVPEAGRQKTMSRYDVNNDSLEDKVYPSGFVEIQRENGDYVCLAKYLKGEKPNFVANGNGRYILNR